MAPSSSTNLGRAFAETGKALLDVHTQLARHVANAATDPWLELQKQQQIDELSRRRDELLLAWARQALSWRVRGGVVELAGEAQGAPDPSTLPSVDDQADGPVVITRTRPVRRVYEPSASSSDEDSAARSARQEAVRDLDHARLTDLLKLLGEPTTPLDSGERIREELSRLTSGCSNARLEEWAAFPKPVQKSLVGMVVARSRHLQDEVDSDLIPAELTGDLDRLFSTMTGYSKREQPGFVFGLQRHHHPMGITWLADARRWWTDLIDFLPEPSVLSPERALAELRRRIEAGLSDEEVLAQIAIALDAGLSPDDPRLVTAVAGKHDALKSEARFKHLRKAIRDAASQDEEAEAELADPDLALPQDWAFEGDVDGRSVAIVGGPVPEAARKRLDEIFRWARSEWVDGHHPRALEDLAEQVRDDEFDLVIVLRRFVGVDADRVLIPMCDQEEVPVADVAQGYGLTAIREAIEDALAED